MNKKEDSQTKSGQNAKEMRDPENTLSENKKQAVLAKARAKFLSAVRSKKLDKELDKKSKTQSTIDYILKPCPGSPNKHEKNQVITNNQTQHPESLQQQNGHTNLKRTASLQKQHSVGSYPIVNGVGEDVPINGISRSRPATVCVDKVHDEANRQTAALALERPRKKLSFREPEIMGYPIQINKDTLPRKGGRKAFTPEMKRNFNNHNSFHNIRKVPSFDLEDYDLEVLPITICAPKKFGQNLETVSSMSFYFVAESSHAYS